MIVTLSNGFHNLDITGRMMIAMSNVSKLTSHMVMNILETHLDWLSPHLLISVI